MAKKKVRKRTGRKIVQSKKVTIDGIQFASTLEGYMYTLLKNAGIANEYEGKSYITFDEFNLKEECFERATKRSKAMIDRRKVSCVRYTPDFIGQDEEWIIEVKGRANESFPLRWKLFKMMISNWRKQPMIFKPTNQDDCKQVLEILIENGYGGQK
jgi:hypothetical protein